MTIKALLATLIGTSVSAAPATPKLELFVKDYPCDAGTCAGDGTCCSGHAAPCCPYVSGQCCASTDSCCPSGTNCYYNPATGKDTCMAGDTAVCAAACVKKERLHRLRLSCRAALSPSRRMRHAMRSHSRARAHALVLKRCPFAAAARGLLPPRHDSHHREEVVHCKRGKVDARQLR